LEGKPLKDIGGKPMIQRVYEAAQQAQLLDEVYVATDDQRIVAAVEQFGGNVRLTSPDHKTGTDRIAEVARELNLPGDAVVVNLQGDEPLIDPGLLAACAGRIGADVPMATCAHPLSEVADVFNPNVVKVVLDKAGRALYFSRATIPWHRDAFAATRDALPAGYAPLRHIGLYAYSNAFLQAYPGLEPAPLEQVEALEQLRVLWHGYPIAVHIADSAPEAGVDTPDDLARVRLHYSS
jgi:3-deoxy-manno-octulosonate cytidylyltransferase (CMP-KDO synthetase)